MATVHLDGTTLEGGGQLLRLALSLSSLTQVPVHITSIRGNRGKPGGNAGGLKPAHLAGAAWLAKATAATTEGMDEKSKELKFQPAGLEALDNSISQGRAVWKDVYENGRLSRRESRITLSTPGAIPLILQAILPYALFSASPVPIRINVEGGTNVSKSPSIEYVTQVLLPLLHTKLGLPKVSTTVHRRGWSVGRSDVGSVTFDFTPLTKSFKLLPFRFSERGEVSKVHCSIFAPDIANRRTIINAVGKDLANLLPTAEVHIVLDENSGNAKRLYLMLVAETTSGYLLGRDWLYEGKLNNKPKRGKKPGPADQNTEEQTERLVAKVVTDLKGELAHGGCVDEHMQDQLVVFQALAEYVSLTFSLCD